MKPKSIFASKAVVGQRYLSKNNLPVRIIEHLVRDVKGIAELTGHTLSLGKQELLYPFKEGNISKEAIIMAKLQNGKAKAVKNGKAEVVSALPGKPVELKKAMGDKTHALTVKPGVVLMDGKRYKSLKEAAVELTGHPRKGDGFGFFGLKGKVRKDVRALLNAKEAA